MFCDEGNRNKVGPETRGKKVNRASAMPAGPLGNTALTRHSKGVAREPSTLPVLTPEQHQLASGGQQGGPAPGRRGLYRFQSP
jgi:hypothetical protein